MDRKVIAVIARRRKVLCCIRDDLRLVFGDRVRYNCLLYDELPKEGKIEGDVVLVSHHRRTQEIRKHVKKDVRILTFQRTFFESDIVKILELPKNSRALVVNDSAMNTMQTADSLNNLNLGNVVMIPFQPGHREPGVTTAITPDEEEFVPPYIERVINIGNRHLDIPTFLDIVHCLKLYDDSILGLLVEYCGRTVSDFMGVKAQYRAAAAANMQMKCLLSHINQGVLVVAPDGTVALGNAYMEKLTEKRIREGETRMEELFGPELAGRLSSLKNGTATFSIHSREILSEHETADYAGELRNVYYFSDVTYIHSLENSIQKKTMDQGYVAKLTFEDAVCCSKSMEACIFLLKKFAQSEKTVLIQGESGTGKELLAQSLHNASKRRVYPFVAVNCAALPETLLESELFGYEKGAFTGAGQRGKPGLFEQAHNGTIFLDEIGDMPVALQTRLLRVLQEREVMRLGSSRVLSVNVRVIAATNRDLKSMMERGQFREDLYYRLNVLPVRVPPLRERREDILPLFFRFSGEEQIPERVKDALLSYGWPGNVRELQNVADYYGMMKDTENSLPDFVTEEGGRLREEQKETSGGWPEAEKGVKKRESGAPEGKAGKPAERTGGRKSPEREPEAEEILKLMAGRDCGTGRRSLRRLLEESGFSVSEYRLRAILGELEEKGLIQIRAGRGGMSLTQRGRELSGRKEPGTGLDLAP